MEAGHCDVVASLQSNYAVTKQRKLPGARARLRVLTGPAD